MTAPLVTVLTPTYNRADWLPETIESVLAQDYPNIEYIVLDDGSRDDTSVVVSSYPYLRYVYQDNQGEPATVNNGWKMARGEYFAVVNSDDLVQNNWLSISIEFMERHPEIIVCYPDWHLIDEESRPVQAIKTFEYSITDMISWFHCIPGPGAIIRKSALPDVLRLREGQFRFCSDMHMWFRLALKGDFARIPQFLATWRRHDGSITEAGDTLERGRELIAMADSFFSQSDLPPHVSALETSAKGRALALASILTRKSHPFRSYYFGRRSIKLKNWDDVHLPLFLRGEPLPGLHKVVARALANKFRNSKPEAKTTS